MEPVEKHPYTPDLSFDGADLDCGSGLLLLIRQHLDKIEDGQIIEILSREVSVEADLPAWCRLTNNELLSWTRQGKQRSYHICRGHFSADTIRKANTFGTSDRRLDKFDHRVAAGQSQRTGSPATARTPTAIAALSVMGIGSWPRPAWLISYLHKHLEGKLSDDEFNAIADDAVKLSVQSQTTAGVDVITDGEQRRDNYASFVGQRLNGCQLIPINDLLPLVDDPDKFKSELDSLDVPADKIRHPAVKGRLSRKTTIACHELSFLSTVSNLPIKIALPGPYLLSRMMWMDCITDKVYKTREELSNDIVSILREEIADLLALGASIIQLDEPVLSEIVFTGAKNTRSFMCGALSERGSSNEELSFAAELINNVCTGFPKDRLAMHVCRGNWTPDESAALSGSYEPMLPLFNSVPIGTLFLEYCTPRAGDLSVLTDLRRDVRVGLGAVNPKKSAVESLDSILEKTRACLKILGPERVLLNPDCGFATFADNPVNTREIAEQKLAVLAKAAKILRNQS